MYNINIIYGWNHIMDLNDYFIISINSLKYSIIIWGYCVNYIETHFIVRVK